LSVQIFEKLKNKSEADTAEQQRLQAEQQQRRSAHAHKEQQRLAELLEDNSSLPVNISSVRILHANRTRHGFLERVVNPILSANREQSYTLDEALREVATATDKLNRFGIFKSPVSVFLDRPDPTNATSSPNDLDVYISAPERGNYTIKTGTEAGASEADAYVRLLSGFRHAHPEQPGLEVPGQRLRQLDAQELG
jgi:outer membrane protein insertion porin family